MTHLRIWHDNSGKSEYASWYLKYIIVHDLQTREQTYFFCQKWFAVELEDGLIDRVLPAAGEAQKKDMKLLIAKQAKTKITDGHLWFSIFAKPTHSAFTRFERVTCCFVLLFISMLANILFYGVSDGNNSPGLTIGPIKITLLQVILCCFNQIHTQKIIIY